MRKTEMDHKWYQMEFVIYMIKVLFSRALLVPMAAKGTR